MNDDRVTARGEASGKRRDGEPLQRSYTRPTLTRWGSLEEITKGPLFPAQDMDGTGSNPI